VSQYNQKLDIKEKILKEAQSLFWKFGVKSVTMDDIAKHISMSKKTIYQYFEDKDEIVNEITKRHLESQEVALEKLKSESQDAVHEMVKISAHIKFSFENLNSHLLFELKKYHPTAYNTFHDHKQCTIIQSIVENLKKGVEQGYYRKEINIAVLAKLRLEQIEMAFDQNIYPASEFMIQDVHVQLFDHFLHGITTLKGHKLLNRYMHIKEEE